MPILEFRCAKCEKVSEELVLAGDVAATPVCPKCGAREMTRLLSTFAAGHSSSGSADFGGCATPGACESTGMCGMGGVCGSGDF